MLEYSRDASAEPLRQLGELLEAVAVGSFLPDSTRSGYFVPRARSPSPLRPSDPVYSPTSSVPSSELGSCGDSETGGEGSDSTEFRLGSAVPSVAVCRRGDPIPANGLFSHRRSGAWHLGGGKGMLRCGRRCSDVYIRMGQWPENDRLWCLQCAPFLTTA